LKIKYDILIGNISKKRNDIDMNMKIGKNTFIGRIR